MSFDRTVCDSVYVAMTATTGRPHSYSRRETGERARGLLSGALAGCVLLITRLNTAQRYNRYVKWLAVALAALVLGGCAKNIDNQEAVQKAVDEYFAGKPGLSSMSARVQSVVFRGNEADATVMVTGKGQAPNTAIPIPYVLERKSSGWSVKGPSKSGMAGHAAQNGGQMPPGHPGVGGAQSGAMPPGHPTGNAPGAEKDGGEKLNLPPDHPPIGGSSK